MYRHLCLMSSRVFAEHPDPEELLSRTLTLEGVSSHSAPAHPMSRALAIAQSLLISPRGLLVAGEVPHPIPVDFMQFNPIPLSMRLTSGEIARGTSALFAVPLRPTVLSKIQPQAQSQLTTVVELAESDQALESDTANSISVSGLSLEELIKKRQSTGPAELPHSSDFKFSDLPSSSSAARRSFNSSSISHSRPTSTSAAAALAAKKQALINRRRTGNFSAAVHTSDLATPVATLLSTVVSAGLQRSSSGHHPLMKHADSMMNLNVRQTPLRLKALGISRSLVELHGGTSTDGATHSTEVDSHRSNRRSTMQRMSHNGPLGAGCSAGGVSSDPLVNEMAHLDPPNRGHAPYVATKAGRVCWVFSHIKHFLYQTYYIVSCMRTATYGPSNTAASDGTTSFSSEVNCKCFASGGACRCCSPALAISWIHHGGSN